MERGIKITLMLTMVVLSGVSVSNAELVVIDFEQLGDLGDGGYLGVSSYSEDGFTLTTTSEFGFYRWSDTDSIVLFSRYGNDMITLTKDDGGTFDFLSIDFYPYFPTGYWIDFTGTLSDNSTINHSFPPFAGNSITLEFDDFTSLVSISWNTSGDYAYFDNINIIPEPATLLLFTIGAVFFRKRHSQKLT